MSSRNSGIWSYSFCRAKRSFVMPALVAGMTEYFYAVAPASAASKSGHRFCVRLRSLIL